MDLLWRVTRRFVGCQLGGVIVGNDSLIAWNLSFTFCVVRKCLCHYSKDFQIKVGDLVEVILYEPVYRYTDNNQQKLINKLCKIC